MFHLEVWNLPSGQEHPIPPEVFDFKDITVQAIVTCELAVANKEDFQDLFHFSSELEPQRRRCGVEVGLRNGKWMVGVNHGLSGSGYIESFVPGAVTGGQQIVKFTKSGSVLRLDIDDTGMSWDLNINDIYTEWLNPAVVVGRRTHGGDFEWLGAIHHLRICSGKAGGTLSCQLLLAYCLCSFEKQLGVMYSRWLRHHRLH